MRADPPGLELVHQLRRIAVELNRSGVEFAARSGLHPTDVRALIALLDAERAQTAATPGWLGVELGLNSASVTAVVDRLERLDLARRERDGLDRRRVLLVVTPQARELGWGFFGPLIDDLLVVIGRLSRRDQNVVGRFLDGALDAVRGRRHGT
jgi:DNA-binding MarR family transcriptional regulator